MTDLELFELQRLLMKLKKTKPELTVLITEYSNDKLNEMIFENKEYCADMIIQIEMCLNDKDDDNLR